MLAKERASWTWVWPRLASHSPPAATTMKWRLLMLGRSATLPWVWQEGWASKKNSNYQQLHTHTSKEQRRNFFFWIYSPIFPHCHILGKLALHIAYFATSAGQTILYLILFFWLRNCVSDSMGWWFVSFLHPGSLTSKVLWMWNISDRQSQGLWSAASTISPRATTLLLFNNKNKR